MEFNLVGKIRFIQQHLRNPDAREFAILTMRVFVASVATV
jgi:hypothetical protein